MSQMREFRLPDVGEGLTEAEVLTWHVAPGDTVTVNQVLVEIETAKASVELPSPYAGVVADLLVEPGAVVPVGTPIIRVDVAPGAGGEPAQPGSAPADSAPEQASPAQPSPEQWAGAASVPPGQEQPATQPEATTDSDTAATTDTAAAAPTRTAVLVGYGVKESAGAPKRRPRVPASTPSGAPAPEAGPAGEPGRPTRIGGWEIGRHTEERLAIATLVKAAPPVRKLARDLGVDLNAIDPTGHDGVVTRDDVARAARLAHPEPSATQTAEPVAASPAGPAVGAAARGVRPTEQPREERIPVRGVLRSMAEAMVRSAFTAPHVTEWVDVDVARSMALLDRLKDVRALAGVRMTPTVLVAAGLLHAVRRNPRVNATFDDDAGEVVVKHYVNLGIAAATPRGLVVPVIPDADLLGLPGLAQELAALVAEARNGKTPPQRMTDGTITITNVGVFGVDGGTPIINPGQVAILAMGRVLPRPWVVDGEVVARPVMQLTLSFDHRCVDGALGSAVLADVAAFLHDPEVALAVG